MYFITDKDENQNIYKVNVFSYFICILFYLFCIFLFWSFFKSSGDMGVGKSCLLHQFTEKKCELKRSLSFTLKIQIDRTDFIVSGDFSLHYA